jgi:hypothetical protein
MRYRKASKCVVLWSILALSVSAALMAQEQQAPGEHAQIQTAENNAVASSGAIPASGSTDKWQFVSLSYLWLPGMSGTVGARGNNTRASVSPTSLVENINIGIMGAFEARYNRWSVPLDYVWVRLSDKKALPESPGYSAKATVNEGFWTPKVNYLVLNSKMAKINVTGGLRYWHLGQDLQLTAPNAPVVSVEASQNWVDFVSGANVVVPLSKRIAVMVLGDAGAGGANVDYQVAGIANYQIKPKWGIGLGYRYLDVDYRNSNRFIFDTHQSGLTLTLLYKYGKQPPIQ